MEDIRIYSALSGIAVLMLIASMYIDMPDFVHGLILGIAVVLEIVALYKQVSISVKNKKDDK